MRHKYLSLFWGILSFILIIISIASPSFLGDYSSSENINEKLDKNSFWSPFIFILIQIFQVVIFPIPGAIVTMVGGIVFGGFLGGIYSIVGVTIGSLIAFGIGRSLGRPFIQKIIGKKDLDHWDMFFKKSGGKALFFTRLCPIIMPSDLISYASSTSNIKFNKYAFYTFLGFIPSLMFISFFGESLIKLIPKLQIFFYVIAGLLFFVFIIRIPLKKYHHKKLKLHWQKFKF